MATQLGTTAPQKTQPAAITLGGLFLALVVPELAVLLLRTPPQGGPGFALREAIFWAITLAVLLYVAFVEKRPLSSIGFHKPTWRTVLWGLCTAFVMILGIAIIYGVVFPRLHLAINTSAMAQIMAHPWPVRLLLVLRAAIFEETLYRGYAIERLTELTGSRIAAALLSCAAFTAVHLSYRGAAQLIVAAFAGLLLTALYLWRRDLPCNMLTHFLTDGIAFLLR
jgi:membrane protease YdiL (CAAX protease family)